jgi:hypothetical protein
VNGTALHFNLGPYRSSRIPKEIIMQDVPGLKYKLALFVGSEVIELQRKDNRTWAPVKRPYVLCLLTTYTHRILCVYRDISPTSQVRVEIQMKSGHLPWAKKDQNFKEIGLQRLFNEYCTSKEHEPTVQGRSYSPTSLLKSDREAQRSLLLESIVFRLNYVSLCALQSVSWQPLIASS